MDEAIEFRSSSNPAAIFVQSIVLCFAIITLAGIVYIFFTMCAIIFHHIAFDHNLKKVPGFVKTSMDIETSSSEEHYDYEEMQAIRAMEKKKELKGGVVHEREREREAVISAGPTYSKKTLLLSEFMMNEREKKAH